MTSTVSTILGQAAALTAQSPVACPYLVQGETERNQAWMNGFDGGRFVGALRMRHRRTPRSRWALQFRFGAKIVIVTPGGAGWFDPLFDKKGDVSALASFADETAFAASVVRFSWLAGIGLASVVQGPELLVELRVEFIFITICNHQVFELGWNL